MKTFIPFLILAALIALPSPVQAAAAENPMLHAAQGAVEDGQGRKVTLRCVNLGSWTEPEMYMMGKASMRGLQTSPSEFRQRLAALVGPEKAADFWRKWIDNFVTEDDFAQLHDAGFNCVRLPLNARDIATFGADGRLSFNPDGIAPADRAVNWGAAHGIYVMIDLHDAPGGQSAVHSTADVPSNVNEARLWTGPEAAANQRATVALWRALAARYAQSTSVGGYDLLNEPDLPKTAPPGTLAGFYGELIKAVRGVDARHMVIIEGDRFAREFSGLENLSDANLMYEFHEYTLFNRAWKDPGAQQLAPFLALRARTGRPLWLGEFGEETLRWQAKMVRLMQDNGIGWAVWPWKRQDLKNNHPAIETFDAPKSWTRLCDYLIGGWFTRRPSPAQADAAMSDILAAIRTPNCRKDSALETVLAGR